MQIKRNRNVSRPVRHLLQILLDVINEVVENILKKIFETGLVPSNWLTLMIIANKEVKNPVVQKLESFTR